MFHKSLQCYETKHLRQSTKHSTLQIEDKSIFSSKLVMGSV